jgi:hypothetical protein
VAKFDADIATLQWDAIAFRNGSSDFTIELPHPAFDANLDRLNALINKARTVAELR